MPVHVVKNHSGCPSDKPHGIVENKSGKLKGCAKTVKDAAISARIRNEAIKK